MESQKQPVVPTTIEGIGIHLSYLLRDSATQSIKLDKMGEKIDALGNQFVTIETYNQHIVEREKNINRIEHLEKNLADFQTIKKIVFGAIAFILVSVLSSLVYLVVKH